MKNKTIAVIALGALAVAGLSACTDDTPDRSNQLQDSQKKFDKRTPPDVTGDTEYNNYIKAQKLYDDPASIIWCTGSFPSDASPIFTVPIAGKLTSSSTSYYPGSSPHSNSEGVWVSENQSVDGMYHGSPPPYRYGFTPGGQYVDFTNLAVFCSTQLTSFQRSTLEVAQTDPADAVTKEAEAKLKAGDPKGAQALLDGIGK